MNPNEKFINARERVIETIAQNMNLYGVTPSIGRLYGLLYFHDAPLTLDEMKNELLMSKASMSTSIRSLQELKMVEKVWKKGERKDLYVAESDWYQTFTDFFTIKWRSGVTMNASVVQESLQELEALLLNDSIDEKLRNEIEEEIDKLKYILDYYDWLSRLVDSFESGEIFKFIPKKER